MIDKAVVELKSFWLAYNMCRIELSKGAIMLA